MQVVQNDILGITENFDDLKMAWFRAGNVMQRRYNVGFRSRDIGVIMLEDDAWEMPRLMAVDWNPELEAEMDDGDSIAIPENQEDDEPVHGSEKFDKMAQAWEDEAKNDRRPVGEIGRSERENQAIERFNANRE